METGYDILFFWVARMMMLGIYKTSQVPFRTVFLHGLVRDEHGQKMSKSKGNVIDPLIEADRLGADAVRLSLIFGSLVENDLNLGEDKIRSMRNFTNKLWNIGRFVIDTKPEKFDKNPKLKDDDKKILVELEETANKVTKALINFRFSESLDALYDFVWHKFADIYIEKSKNRREESQATLEKVFSTSLLLLHPFMPFITEELWHRLGNKDSIMIQNWPA
jgi:valyl-tRNA synthetase